MINITGRLIYLHQNLIGQVNIILNASEWFKGLTQCFLSIKIPRLLLLAASDRMDKELTIAQMQGKFRLSVINNVGHIVQEDDPKGTASVIRDFIQIFRIPELYSDIKPIVGKLGSTPKPIPKYEEYKNN